MLFSRRLILNDTTSPEAIAFWDYAKKLKFITIEEDIELKEEEIAAIEEARISLEKKGGYPHDSVIEKMKNKYPNAFKK